MLFPRTRLVSRSVRNFSSMFESKNNIKSVRSKYYSNPTVGKLRGVGGGFRWKSVKYYRRGVGNYERRGGVLPNSTVGSPAPSLRLDLGLAESKLPTKTNLSDTNFSFHLLYLPRRRKPHVPEGTLRQDCVCHRCRGHLFGLCHDPQRPPQHESGHQQDPVIGNLFFVCFME